MPDKFVDIKEEWTAVGDISGGDINWLIKEVERLRIERAEVIEELARRYGGMFASPGSEPSITEVFREAQQLAQRRVRRERNDV